LKTSDIIVADDHPIVRFGTKQLLECDPSNRVVGEAGTFDDLFALLSEVPCEILVLSLQLSGGMFNSGMAAIAKVRRIYPDIRIIAFPDMCSPQSIRVAISIGVMAVISKSASERELRRAVNSAKRGARYLGKEVRRQVIADEAPRELTHAEELVLQLLADGRNLTEIANLLGKSAATVSSQKQSAMRKLGFHSMAQLYEHIASWRRPPAAASDEDPGDPSPSSDLVAIDG